MGEGVTAVIITPVMIQNHFQFDVYQLAMDAAMRVFELSKQFPIDERYSLTDQTCRSSRSVCANLAEAWRKCHYEAAFISKLSDAEAEAAETQVWIEFAVKCNYLERETAAELHEHYDQIIKTIVGMIVHAKSWTIKMKG